MPEPVAKLAYPPEEYTEDLVLQIPLLLWLVILFANHALVLFLLGNMPGTAGHMSYFLSFVNPIDMLFSAPALAVLLAAGFRRPSSGAIFRRIWRWGASLLALALALQLATHGLTVAGVLHGGRPASSPLPAIFMAIEVFGLAVVLGMKRVRDTFLEFPAPVADERPG